MDTMRPRQALSGPGQRSRDPQLWNAKLNVGYVTEPLPRDDACLVLFDSLSRYELLKDASAAHPPEGVAPEGITFFCKMLHQRAHPVCGGPFDLPEKGDKVLVAFPQGPNYGVILGCLSDAAQNIIPQTGDPGLLANDYLYHHYSDVYDQIFHNGDVEKVYPSRESPGSGPSEVYLKVGKIRALKDRERVIESPRDDDSQQVTPFLVGDNREDMVRRPLPNITIRYGKFFLSLSPVDGILRIGIPGAGALNRFRIEREGGASYLEFTADGSINIQAPTVRIANLVEETVEMPPPTDFPPTD